MLRIVVLNIVSFKCAPLAEYICGRLVSLFVFLKMSQDITYMIFYSSLGKNGAIATFPFKLWQILSKLMECRKKEMQIKTFFPSTGLEQIKKLAAQATLNAAE